MDAPHAMDSASSDGDTAKSLIPGLAAAFIHDAVTAALCFKSLYYDVACVSHLPPHGLSWENLLCPNNPVPA